MLSPSTDFGVNHNGVEIRYGSGCIAGLGALMSERGLRRAMVVCGSNVGSNEELMAPLRAGLGDALAGVFDGTTSQKSIASVYAGIDRARELEADVLVGVGGGSSLDIARQISAFGADGRSIEDVEAAARAGTLQPPSPQPDALPAMIVPTTLAGADLSYAGSIQVLAADETDSGQPVHTMGTTKPLAVIFDPDLFASTPPSVMYGSTMNGFNKGLETIYSPNATPLSDALAIHGVHLMIEGIDAFGRDYAAALRPAVAGLVLVQMERRVSIIHAVARGVSRFTDVQQGVAHAILAPYVVQHLLTVGDTRRELLASALGIDPSGRSNDELAAAIVARLGELPAALEIPSRLSEVLDTERFDVAAAAAYVCDQPLMQGAPLPEPASVGQVEAILRGAF